MSEVWHFKMKSNDVNLYFRGDIHLGSKQAAIESWMMSNKIIMKDPLAFDFGMGDIVDSIIAKDKRYDPFNRDPSFESIDDAFSFFEDSYESIKDKSGGLLVGNHEWTLIQATEMNETRKICKRFNIPYLGFSALIKFQFPNGRTLIGFLAHGAGGGRKIGSKANRLDEVKGKFIDADFTVFAHTHELFTRASPVLLLRNDKLVSKTVHMASSGSFLRNYVPDTLGYGERALYDPLPIGFVYLEIRDGTIKEGFRYHVV